MMEVFQTLLLMLVTTWPAVSYCPQNHIHNIGHCGFRIHCINNIRGFSLPDKCKEAVNNPVTVDVTLTEAIERFDKNLDLDFLGRITKLKISGQWKQTELSILEYTTQLQTLNISNNHIEQISGTPFYNSNNLEILDISHNRLTEIDDLFQLQYPNKLKRLLLSSNAIEDIPGDAFSDLTFLTELDLSCNIISDLTEEPFYNLTNLQILRLANNRIKDLNGAINNLQNLKQLYIRGNQIENIEVESLKIITHLEVFDVSQNQLERIKPVLFSRHWEHFGNDTSVCKIILADNHIIQVPNATYKEESMRFARNLERRDVNIITELDLSGNSIRSIEYNAFKSLVKLVSLDLSRNKIIDFVVNSEDLADIKYLNLSGNYISRLYFKSFSTMSNLQNLDLSFNRLDYVPAKTFTNNNNLKLVNMTYNEIENLDSIQINVFHPSGGVLDLSHNGLFTIKIPFGEGVRLVTLILNSNNITDTAMVNLDHQTDLRLLDLSHNLISVLKEDSVHLPVNIVYLDLGFNKISFIETSSFRKLGHLKTLRLSHNNLKNVEYGMFQGLPALMHLDLSFNSIKVLDSYTLMDLKALRVLSVRSNGMYWLDYKNWYGNRIDLQVYIDENNFTCEWLSRALSDNSKGFSKMMPTVLRRSSAQNSVDGIPCVAGDSEPLVDAKPAYVMVDERLLVINEKILEAVQNQNYFLRKIAWRNLVEYSDKDNKVA